MKNEKFTYINSYKKLEFNTGGTDALTKDEKNFLTKEIFFKVEWIDKACFCEPMGQVESLKLKFNGNWWNTR